MADDQVVLTLFSTKGPLLVSAWGNIHESVLSALAARLSIDLFPRPSGNFLDGQSTSDSTHRVTQFILSTTNTLTQAQCTDTIRALVPVTSPLEVEAVLIPMTPLHRSAAGADVRGSRLAVFDMDSTLIQQEVIDELARSLDLYASVAAITEAAMRGDPPYTDFASSLRARVALLKGVEGNIWDHLKEKVITFTPGARELIACLAADGWKTAVLSGGFINLASWVKSELGMDYAFANELAVDEAGKLTGEVKEGAVIVDGARKRVLMLKIAEEAGIATDRIVAVGDGSNDLPMMGEAALGVAFCAKPKVQELAPARVNGGTLIDVLYILGWTEEAIKTHAV